MVISSGFMLFKLLFVVIATLGFLWLLLVATLEAHEANRTTTSAANFIKHDKVELGREKLIYDPELDFNYMMSKRKVPNGPDPIHNRRAGNSKRPPGRV
ncbi:CLAVATA3/ESR (CLE)-related protein 25 [Jatropha curcas]|uniref:CLAVATA3/ESR (CLE)-related protein 25 n=1 Tax=Jatropha curcas TaxID=180498 RepID=UPI0005FB3391|nr:CLAVATA3/ESR (CLE)-related protein 25 [Jatropha curcas]